jgi:hypothetical protein
MPGMMMMKDKKPAAKPMAYKKGGMVKKPMSYEKGGMVPKAMHKMPDGKMMPGAKHGSTKSKK